MAEKYKWCANEPVVGYKDPDGREYCVFHAPQGEKGITSKEFNEKVFLRIGQEFTKGLCDLSGTVFMGDIRFSRFENQALHVNFNDAIFNGKADFSRVTFSGDAYFFGALFGGEASFDGAIFSGDAYFLRRAKFSGKASFYRAIFSGDAYFDATFSVRASFDGAKFSGKASFHRAIFSGDAYFDATFSGEAYFSVATFSKETYFSMAIFNERVFFDMAEFKEKSLFERAVFNKHVYFKGKTFFSGGVFQDLNISEIMSFDGADLSKVTFLDTDMRKIDAVNCTWARYHNRDALYDEISLYNDPENKGLIKRWKKYLFPGKKALSKVESLYRKLKQKCKEDHDEQQASNWHYCEKEIFRKANLRRRFFGLTALYCLSSGYGERVFRSGVFLVLLILGLPLLLAYGGLVPTGEGQADLVCINGLYDAFSFKNYQAIVLNTLQFATFQKATFFRPNSHPGEWFKVFTQILIPLQATLFAFAVRNRFRR